MEKRYKSGIWLAVAALLGAASVSGQQPYDASAARAVDRTASRSFDTSYSTSVSLTGGISLGAGGGGGARSGQTSGTGVGTGVTAANIASICARESAQARVASACSAAGYTASRFKRTLGPVKVRSTADSLGASASGGAVDTPMGDDLQMNDDALAEDSSMDEEAPSSGGSPPTSKGHVSHAGHGPVRPQRPGLPSVRRSASSGGRASPQGVR